jgi:nitroimidazol reductase NimA-like FMN-containing flavoprotein (pyridoxamine 5'-phosphate oxidase superfamily)
MFETDQDLERLQELLDRGYDDAGDHLKEVITPERRLDAVELCGRLTEMRLLTLATITSDYRPIAGPVDGIFFRGAFHFGSSPNALRISHIRNRPWVSATYLPGEELSVTVHGEAHQLDMKASETAQLRKTVLDIYVPTYGPEWESFLDANVFVRIEARRMFTFFTNG